MKIYLLSDKYKEQLEKDIQSVNDKAATAETGGEGMSVLGILQAGLSNLVAKYRPLAVEQDFWRLEHGRIYSLLRIGLFSKHPLQRRLALYLNYRVDEEFRCDLVQGGYVVETVPEGSLFVNYRPAGKEYGLFRR